MHVLPAEGMDGLPELPEEGPPTATVDSNGLMKKDPSEEGESLHNASSGNATNGNGLLATGGGANGVANGTDQTIKANKGMILRKVSCWVYWALGLVPSERSLCVGAFYVLVPFCDVRLFASVLCLHRLLLCTVPFLWCPNRVSITSVLTPPLSQSPIRLDPTQSDCDPTIRSNTMTRSHSTTKPTSIFIHATPVCRIHPVPTTARIRPSFEGP
jgi:hypothetical protein